LGDAPTSDWRDVRRACQMNQAVTMANRMPMMVISTITSCQRLSQPRAGSLIFGCR
jgi:hypothetical protein